VYEQVMREAREMEETVIPQVVEMAKIKCQFDAEKFSVGTHGGFIASMFHFLMRQYRFAIMELKRKVVEHEEKRREGERLRKRARWWFAPRNIDLDIVNCQDRMTELKIDIQAKRMMIRDFEAMRLELIKQNGGPITAEQYDAEQPDYYQWMLAEKAVNQITAQVTGIHEGVIEALKHASSRPLMPGSKMVTNSPFVAPGLVNVAQLIRDSRREIDEYIEVDKRAECDFVSGINEQPENPRLLTK